MKTTKNQIKQLKHLLKNDSHSQHHLKTEITKNILPHIFDKEETYQITKEQILTIAADGCTYVEEWFPSAFQEDKKELVINRWIFVERDENYINNEIPALVLYQGEKQTYGFSHVGKWLNNYGSYGTFTNPKYKYRKATPQEIQQALKNEARKRYKVGDKITDAIGRKAIFTGKIIYHEGTENNGISNGNNMWIMRNGIWAEVIKPKQMTKEQIEKELGYEISII